MTHQVNAKWVEPMGSFKSQKKIPTWNLYLTAITEAAVAFINQLLSATFGIFSRAITLTQKGREGRQ